MTASLWGTPCQVTRSTAISLQQLAHQVLVKGLIRVYRADSGDVTCIKEIDLHFSPVKVMALAPIQSVVVSIDLRGMIEYWAIDSLTSVSSSECKEIHFALKTETDLYDLAKAKTMPCALAVSPTGRHFATLSRDKMIRVFDLAKGKLLRKYDESAQIYGGGTKDGSMAGTVLGLDALELSRRQAVERVPPLLIPLP